MANWKLLGLAGVVGVAAAGAAVARRSRTWEEPTADELRDRLRKRLEEADSADAADAEPAGS